MSKWGDLHPEVLSSIRHRLFRQDYSNFRATCGSWNFRAEFDRVVYDNVKFPFLLHFSRSSNDSCSCGKAYSAAYDKTYYLRTPIEFIDAKIYCSLRGWLLFGRGEQVFFYHPSTERFIELPIPAIDSRVPFHWMSFSAPPTSSKCMVLGLKYSESAWKAEISFIQRGQCSWKHYSDVPNRMRLHNYRPAKLRAKNLKRIRVIQNVCQVNAQRFPCIGELLWSNSDSPPMFYKGVFYCLARDGRLGVFNPREKEEEKMWRLLQKTSVPSIFMDNPSNEAYLLECKGDLISIVVGPMGKSVRILKLYERTELWQTIHSIQDQMIFLSHAGCAVMKCDRMQFKGFENTIHFPRFFENLHVFYSILRGQFHSFGGQYVSDDLYETYLPMTHTWMIPTFCVSYSSLRSHWSSKPRQRPRMTKNGQHLTVHPHYAIRNLTFLPPPSSGHSSLGSTQAGSKMRMGQEAPAAHPCFVLMNEAGEQEWVSLDDGSTMTASARLRIAEVAARMGSNNRVYSKANSGMLVLIDDVAGRCSLFDPSSMTATWLPPWGTSFTTRDVVHLSPSNISKSVVMVFGTRSRPDQESGEEAIAMAWREGAEKWTTLYTYPTQDGIDPRYGVVVCGDKIYGLYPTLYLAVVEVHEKRYSHKPVAEFQFPTFRSVGSMRFETRLTESGGELLLLIKLLRAGCGETLVGEPILVDIQAFKMDWETMRWEIMEDLGDRAFFWSYWTCYSCCASKSGFQRNSIYFIDSTMNSLRIFDYGERTIFVSRPCTDILDNLMEPVFFMWYAPQLGKNGC